MPIRPSLWIPIALLSANFLLRLSLISIGPYHLDCLALALNAENFLNTGRLPPMFGPGYPATILLSAAFIKLSQLFGLHDSVLAVNFMSVTMASFGVLAFYLLARELISEKTAFWGGVAFTFSPIFLSLSTYGTSHTPSICFLLLGLYAAVRFLKSQQRRDMVTAGLWLGLMGAARAQDLVLVAIPIGILIMFPPIAPSLKVSAIKRGAHVVYLGLISAFIALVFHLPFFLQTFSTYGGQFFEFWRTGVAINFRGLFSESLLDSLQLLYRELGIGAFLAATGIIFLNRRPRLLVFLLLWIALPLAFYGNLYSTVPRFFMIFLPAIYLCVGYTAQRLFHYSRGFKNVIIAVFVGMIIVNYTFIYPYLHERHTNAHLPEYGRWVGRITEPNAVILASDEGLFIQHYGRRKVEGSLFEPFRIAPQQLQHLKERIDHHIQKGHTVYITAAGLYAYDPDAALSGFIKSHYKVSAAGSHVYEDWHLGCLVQDVFRMRLYRIQAPGS